MTQYGLVHIISAIYLAAVISFAVSLNENRDPRRILRETVRRWGKFLAFGLILAVAINLIIKAFA